MKTIERWHGEYLTNPIPIADLIEAVQRDAIEACAKVVGDKSALQWKQARVNEDDTEEAEAYEHAAVLLDDARKAIRALAPVRP